MISKFFFFCVCMLSGFAVCTPDFIHLHSPLSIHYFRLIMVIGACCCGRCAECRASDERRQEPRHRHALHPCHTSFRYIDRRVLLQSILKQKYFIHFTKQTSNSLLVLSLSSLLLLRKVMSGVPPKIFPIDFYHSCPYTQDFL